MKDEKHVVGGSVTEAWIYVRSCFRFYSAQPNHQLGKQQKNIVQNHENPKKSSSCTWFEYLIKLKSKVFSLVRLETLGIGMSVRG